MSATMAHGAYEEKVYPVEFRYDSYDDLWGTGLSSDWDDTVDSPWLVPGVQPMLGLCWMKCQINMMVSGLARHLKTHIGGNIHVWYDPAQVYALPDRTHTFDVYFSFEPVDLAGNELEDYLGLEGGITVGGRLASPSDVWHWLDFYSGDWNPTLFQKHFSLLDLGVNIQATGSPTLGSEGVTGDDGMDFMEVPLATVEIKQKEIDLKLKFSHHMQDKMQGLGVSGQVVAPTAAPLFNTGVFTLQGNNITRERRITLGVPAGYSSTSLPIQINDLLYQSRIDKYLGMTFSLLCFDANYEPDDPVSSDWINSKYTDNYPLCFSIPLTSAPPLPDLKPKLSNVGSGAGRYPGNFAFANERMRFYIYPSNIGDAPLPIAYDSNYGAVVPPVSVYVDGQHLRDLLFEEQTVLPGQDGNCIWFDHTFTTIGFHSIKIVVRDSLEEMNYANNTAGFDVRVYPERGTIFGTIEDLGAKIGTKDVYTLKFDGQLHEKLHFTTTATLAMNPTQPASKAYFAVKASPDLYNIEIIPPAGSTIVPIHTTLWHANYTDELNLQMGHYGTIQGVVLRDDDHKPIAGATVNIASTSTLTNALGQYQFAHLPWGEYTLTAYKPTTGSLSMEYDFSQDARDTWEKKVAVPATGIAAIQDFYLLTDKTGPADCTASLDVQTTPTGLNNLPFILYGQDAGYAPYKVKLSVQGHAEYPAIEIPYDPQPTIDIGSWALPSGNFTLLVTFYDSWGNASTPVAVALARDATPIDVSLVGLTINSGAALTNERLVSLAISPAPPEAPAAMQIKNEDTSDWSDPMEYRPTRYWLLSSNPISGTKTASVRFADRAGNWSAPLSDSIQLDASGAVKINGGASYTNSRNVTVGFTIDPLVDTYMSTINTLGDSADRTMWSQAWVANTSTLTGISVDLNRNGYPYDSTVFPVEVYFTANRAGFNPNNSATWLAKHTFEITDISGPKGNWVYLSDWSAQDDEPYGGQYANHCEYFKLAPALNLNVGQNYYLIVRAPQVNAASTMKIGTQMNYGMPPQLFPERVYLFSGGSWQPLGANDWMTCRFYGRPYEISNNGTSWTSISNDGSPMNWTLNAGDGLQSVFIRYQNRNGQTLQYFDQIAVDTTPPGGTAQIVDSVTYDNGYGKDSRVILGLSAADTGAYPSGVQWARLYYDDTLGWIDFPYADRIQIGLDDEGAIDIKVKFVDQAGNESPIVHVPFMRHLRGPDASITINHGAMYATNPVLDIDLSTTWTVADYYLSGSEGTQWAWIPYERNPLFKLPKREGSYSVDVLFRDQWGNTGATARGRIMLDLSAPSIELFSINAGDELTTTSFVTLNSRCSDFASGVWQYRAAETTDALSSAPWNDYYSAAPFTLSLGDGTKEVYFQVRDRAGWISDAAVSKIKKDTAAWSHTLKVNATHGSVVRSPNVTLYEYGTTVTLTATAATNYRFVGWSGNVPSGHESDNPLKLCMDADKAVTARFVRLIGTVSVNVTPNSGGWSFTDGDGAAHSGVGDDTITSVPTGSIVLTWNALANYDSPAPNPQTKTLASGATIAFAGTYARQLGTVVVNVSPTSATWSFTDGASVKHQGQGDSRLVNVPCGSLVMTWTAPNGYTPPKVNPVTKNLAKGAEVCFSEILIPSNSGPLQDAARIVRYLLGLDTDPTGLDANQDGKIDIADAIWKLNSVPPAAPSAPAPANGAVNVPVSTRLTWAPCNYAKTYDLFLWKSSVARPALPTRSGITSCRYTPATNLTSDTAYRWQVIARNTNAVTTGTTWRFTTIK